MKKFFKRIGEFFRMLFSSTKIFLGKYVEPAIGAVNVLKGIVNSPITRGAVAATKNKFDDAVLAGLDIWLPKAAMVLGLLKDVQGKTASEALEIVVEKIREYDPSAQDAIYLNIASMTSQALSDGKLSFGEAVVIVQYWYSEQYQKKRLFDR